MRGPCAKPLIKEDKPSRWRWVLFPIHHITLALTYFVYIYCALFCRKEAETQLVVTSNKEWSFALFIYTHASIVAK
jgi:hypothetical protein